MVRGESVNNSAGTTGITQIYLEPLRICDHPTHLSKMVLGDISSSILSMVQIHECQSGLCMQSTPQNQKNC